MTDKTKIDEAGKPVDSAGTNASAAPVETGSTKRPIDKATSFENFPSTKTEVIKYVTDYFSGLSVDSAKAVWSKVCAEFEAGDATHHGKFSGSQTAEHNKSTIKTYKEDLDSLLASIELPEEFKEKAAIIFESVVAAKITEVTAKLEEDTAAKVEASLAETKAELEEKVKSFISTFAEKYIEENKLAIVSNLRLETAKSFIAGMKKLFAEHHVSLPEEEVSVVEELAAENDTLEDKLSAQIAENVALTKKINELESKAVLEGLLDGLADTQKDKVRELAAAVEFSTMEDYTKKVTVFKESVTTTATKPLVEGVLDDAVEPEVKDSTVPPAMAGYIEAMKRLNKKH